MPITNSLSIVKRPYELSWSGNPITYQLFSVNAYYNPDVVVEVQVYWKKVNDPFWKLIDTLPYNPSKGYVNANIQELLDSVLEYDLPQFATDERTVWPTLKQSCNFYIAYREVIPGEAENEFVSGETRTAIKGGISYMQWRGNNYWKNYWEVNKPFFTWQKNGRLASYEERMYLAWMNYTDFDPGQLLCNFKIYYTDGDTYDVPAILVANYMDAKGTIYYLPVGALQNDLNSYNPDKAIYYWTVQVVHHYHDFLGTHDDPMSELFYYYLDNRNDYNLVNLHYRNSLGGLDSIRVRGTIEGDLNYNYTELDRVVDDYYYSGHFVNPAKIIAAGKEEKVFKGDTSWVTKAEQDRLRDMHVIREGWWCVNKKWLPILNETGNFKQNTTDDKLWSMPIQWKLSNNSDQYFTPSELDLGEAIAETDVCYAGIIDIAITVDTGGTLAEATINLSVEDPDAVGVTTFQYKIPGVVDDWTDVLLSALPLVVSSLPKETSYQFMVRAKCPNGVGGLVTPAGFNTNTTGGGGTGTGSDSSFENDSVTNASLTVFIDDVEVITDMDVPASSTVTHALDDAIDVTVAISVTGLSLYSSTGLISNGIVYTDRSIIGNQVIYRHVTIQGGIQFIFS